jgi:hypothetical protein
MISWREQKQDEKEYGPTAPFYEAPKAASPVPQALKEPAPIQGQCIVDLPEFSEPRLKDVPAIQRPSNKALHERRTVRCPNCSLEFES